MILEHRNFVKKLIFPLDTLPVNQVVAGLGDRSCSPLGFSWPRLLMIRGAIPVSVLWLPVLLIPQLLFTLGACWFLAALGVFLRDLGQIMGFLLTLWFFITPICYPESRACPRRSLAILRKNPMFVLVRGYRAIFLEGHAPGVASLGQAVGRSAAGLSAGPRLVLQTAKKLRGCNLKAARAANRLPGCVRIFARCKYKAGMESKRNN